MMGTLGINTERFERRMSTTQRFAAACDNAKDLAQQAATIVAEDPVFRGRSTHFQFEIRDDVIIVRGELPSFYLKQLLQKALKKLDGIRYIDNQVNVVSSDGLSGQTTLT
jgi:hypothetical protein